MRRDRDDRDGRPEHEPAEHDRQVRGASHEQRYGQREQGVLDELEEAHEMVVEQRVVEGDRAERLEREPGEEGCAGQPEPAPRAEARQPVSRGDERRRDHDDEDGHIGQTDVDGCPAEADSEVRLVALVQKEERDGTREHERSERGAVDEVTESRRRACAVERLGRHRATIGRRLRRSFRGMPSLH